MLVEDGFLNQDDLNEIPDFSLKKVDFDKVEKWKTSILRKAHVCFLNNATSADQMAFNGFCRENASWLNDFALFSALMDYYQQSVWTTWPQAFANEMLRPWRNMRKYWEAM